MPKAAPRLNQPMVAPFRPEACYSILSSKLRPTPADTLSGTYHLRPSTISHIQRRRKQDYAVTLVDLELFCATLDPSKHSDLVAGALATTLFWALGRLHELLHAKKFKRMRIDSIEEAINRSTLRRSFRIFLERPKMRRAGEMQFLAPLRHLGISNPQHWMTLLLYSISEQSFEVSSPWQLDSDTHADSKWLLGKFGQVLEPMSQRLGPSSFRAGGYTHMAYMGYELSLLRLFSGLESIRFIAASTLKSSRIILQSNPFPVWIFFRAERYDFTEPLDKLDLEILSE
jgi:hypothetical protein